jgi:hypothetical protein
VKAGASWEQIGAARGTSTDRARRDYRERVEGQHNLLTWTEGRIGMSDAEYAKAIARFRPQTYPGEIGDPASIGIQARSRIPCAHAGQDGQGMHRKLPGPSGKPARLRCRRCCRVVRGDDVQRQPPAGAATVDAEEAGALTITTRHTTQRDYRLICPRRRHVIRCIHRMLRERIGPRPTAHIQVGPPTRGHAQNRVIGPARHKVTPQSAAPSQRPGHLLAQP